MKVTINGDYTDIIDNGNIMDLLNSFKLDDVGIIVVLNEHVVKRDRWRETTLNEGDRIEIVRIIGGG